jgi:hypothetical protein
LSTNLSLPTSTPPLSGRTAVTLPPPARSVASASPRLRCGRLNATEIGSSWVIVTSALPDGWTVLPGKTLIAPARPAAGATIRLYERPTCADSIAARSAATTARAESTSVWLVSTAPLRDEVLREQILAARQLALGIGERGLVLGELRPRLGDVDLVVARVEHEQRLAGADELAFLDLHLGDRARDLGPDVDAVERGHRAGRFEHHVDVLLLDDDGGDADRRPGRGRGRRRRRRDPATDASPVAFVAAMRNRPRRQEARRRARR